MFMDKDDVAVSDLISLGMKVVEMADLLQKHDQFAPGMKATGAFELGDHTFEITLRVKQEEKA